MRRPEEVKTHEFMDKELVKAILYGIYDMTTNEGRFSVGIDHDTAYFATESLRRWSANAGSKVYPKAKELLVTVNGGRK